MRQKIMPIWRKFVLVWDIFNSNQATQRGVVDVAIPPSLRKRKTRKNTIDAMKWGVLMYVCITSPEA